MILPEVIIYDKLTFLLSYVKTDLEQNRLNLKDSYLYKLFKEAKYDKFVFFNQGRQILELKDKRALAINIGYNIDRVNVGMPTIHIIIPASNKGSIDGIGFDEGYEESEYSHNETKKRVVLSRSYNSTFDLMITSDNIGEVLFVHRLLKGLIIGGYEQFELDGLMNLSLAEQDITLQQDLIPISIYHRNLRLTCTYEDSIPAISQQDLLKTTAFKFTGVSVG